MGNKYSRNPINSTDGRLASATNKIYESSEKVIWREFFFLLFSNKLPTAQPTENFFN